MLDVSFPILFIAILAAIIVIWYVIYDRVASTSVDYVFPASCSRCNSTTDRLKRRKVSRQWYFLADHEVLDYVFPHAERTAEITICEMCSYTVEIREESAHTLSKRIAAILFVPLSIGLWLVGDNQFFLDYPFLHSLCGFVVPITMGLFFSLVVYLIIGKVLTFFPRFAPPAYFTMFGKLRFRNKLYQQEFSRLNPSPEVPLPQHQLPIGIFLGIAVAVILSIMSDIFNIADAFLSKSTDAISTMSTILILGKTISVPLILLRSKLGVILWVTIFVVGIVANPNFSDDQLEDIFIGTTLLSIFIYEWWQTQPNGGHSGR